MRNEFRTYPYRPPYKEKQYEKGAFNLLLRLVSEYVKPFARLLSLCIILAALDYVGSFYLLAFYQKVVLDYVLVINPPPTSSSFHQQNGFEREGVSKHLNTKFIEQTTREKPSEGMGRKIDRGVSHTKRQPYPEKMLAGLFLLYIITIIAANIMNRRASKYRIQIAQAMTVKLREKLHEKILKLSLSFQLAHTPGRLMARVTSDVNAISEQILTIIVNGVSQILIVVVGVILIIAISPPVILITLCFLPFYVITNKLAHKPLVRANREISHTNSCLYGLASQKLDAIRLIQGSGRERYEYLLFHRLSAVFFRDIMWQNRLGATTSSVAQLLSFLANGICIFLYVMYEVFNGNMTLGNAMYVWGTSSALFAPVLALSNMNVVISNLLVNLNRVFGILDEPLKIKDAPDARPLPTPLSKGIDIINISFKYREDAPIVFETLSLSIRTGEWLCITGPSGAGKSTLLMLLCRLFDPQKGEILYDNIPLNKISLASLRRNIAMVPQEPQIMSGTVRDNICYGNKDATPSEIIAASKAAELHDFIMTLPVKYETILGEKGTSLSGGQRQRLALARALLTNPEILLLDDCTSALDAETEANIQKTLSHILVGKTAVIVSSRVSMAMKCHRVCVMENGCITQLGTHNELIKQQGFYARLCEKQLKK